MFTQVRTPQDVFFSPQKLLVPLFQRPYVWNRESQWQPLWSDVIRVAERIEKSGSSATHFLGAVVLQQQLNEIGSLSTRTVIDGQQRLTTLQLLIDAIRRELKDRNLDGVSTQALNLVQNQSEYRRSAEDTFKVWPTNRDREAFGYVMQDQPASIDVGRSRIVEAHSFFRQVVSEWLDEGDAARRGQALFDTVSRFVQLVVIDLQPDEDAQEIFETLNARGTPLTAADLIKNFVFQRLDSAGKDAETAYLKYWHEFETPFWEELVSAGRLQYTRSSLFLTQWLVSQTREDITAREVFNRFKFFVLESAEPVEDLLPRLRRSADTYRRLVEASMAEDKNLSRSELFIYRMSTLDSEVIKPLVLWYLDPELTEIPKPQLEKALATIESWAVRRAILRLSTKNYNRLVVELLNVLHSAPRDQAGDITEQYFARQVSSNSYWPTDKEIFDSLTREPIYRKVTRARLRMILEALEDSRRGIWSEKAKFSEGPVSRGKTSIEHLLPQDWRSTWVSFEFDEDAVDEHSLVHQLGNLTLLTQPLNSKVSNSTWPNKKQAFEDHTTLLLTADVLKMAPDDWTADLITQRSKDLASKVIEIWPVSPTNKGLLEMQAQQSGGKVQVSDLINEGYLKPGQPIFARTQAHFGRIAYLSEDGGIFVDGKRFETPSRAAREVSGNASEQGWWFWVVDTETLESLSDLRTLFLAQNQAEDDQDDIEG